MFIIDNRSLLGFIENMINSFPNIVCSYLLWCGQSYTYIKTNKFVNLNLDNMFVLLSVINYNGIVHEFLVRFHVSVSLSRRIVVVLSVATIVLFLVGDGQVVVLGVALGFDVVVSGVIHRWNVVVP